MNSNDKSFLFNTRVHQMPHLAEKGGLIETKNSYSHTVLLVRAVV